MSHPLDQWIEAQLSVQSEYGLLRSPPITASNRGIRYVVDGRELVSFCSNDYLGFAGEAMQLEVQNSGAAASRLIHGDFVELRELEANFAARLGFEDAVLSPSGYQGNLAALAQLPVMDGGILYSDALNHASIIDALRRHPAPRKIIDHGSAPPPDPTSWWLTESRFSMDGDSPDLETLDSFVQAGGNLFLDEAHAFGLEKGGLGLAQSLTTRPTLCAYPLGKSFGLQGSIIAGTAAQIRWLRQFSRAYIYSTAVSPILVAAIELRAREFFGEAGERRLEQLQLNLRYASDCLERPIQSPITIVPCASNQLALQHSRELLEMGFHVQAIRPPTVPEGGTRLRITWSASHSRDEVERFCRALRRLEQRA